MRTLQHILFVMALAAGVLPAPYATGQNVDRGPWTGQWIACPNAPARDEAVFHFRKRIVLTGRPEHLLLQVSADNQFLLVVNGHRAGSGPARGDLGHWRYETLDVGPLLHAGENWIGATVWNFGSRTAIAQVSDRTAFYINSVDKRNSAFETNASWQVEQESGIHTLAKPASLSKFYYAAEPATRMEGAHYDWDWESPASTGVWQSAVSLGAGGLRDAMDMPVNWRFEPDPLPPMEMELRPTGRVVRSSGVEGVAGVPAQSLLVPAHTKASLLVDNTVLTTAYPELTISQGKDALVRLTYTEALVDKDGVKGNRNEIAGKSAFGIEDEFVPDGRAMRVFQPLVWRTWRYLKIDVETADQPLRLEGLRSWFTAYPFEERGSFLANDPSLEQIWKIGWRTARLDAHSTYMDTPYWEQLQYVGDTRIQALVSYAVSGDDRLARQAIEAINNTRLPEGITLSRGPTALFQAIPPFSLLWVGMVHDFWMYRDDPGFVRAQLAGTRTVLDWFLQRVREDGMVGRLPWWPFVDWTEGYPGGIPPQDGNGGSSAITLQMVRALREAAELEESLGEPSRAEIYRRAAQRSAKAVRTLCWNETVGLIADTGEQKEYSQEANALAVWLDVIPPDKQQAALRTMLSGTDPAFKPEHPAPQISPASYYFRFYVARAVEHAGMGDLYTQMLDPWRGMIRLGLTTWAEKPEPTRSDSHAWSASPNYDLPTIVAGIRPGSPGFRTVKIEPHLGSLTHVIAQMPHPKGMVAVEFTRNPGQVAATITLPEGVSGELAWQGQQHPLHGGKQEILLKDAGVPR
ncbi:MAG TPA: alpha-L-rhamnosidase C-terminal domain-containing protein [Acidobacteriaceae bacterium]|nr:alpha-L-rhamnosidase C-terminal domain-containing protein [Acidobacteriaceae bacterium]